MRQISNETDYRNPASSITLGHSIQRGVVLERIGERSDGKMNRIGGKTEAGDGQRQRNKEKDRGDREMEENTELDRRENILWSVTSQLHCPHQQQLEHWDFFLLITTFSLSHPLFPLSSVMWCSSVLYLQSLLQMSPLAVTNKLGLYVSINTDLPTTSTISSWSRIHFTIHPYFFPWGLIQCDTRKADMETERERSLAWILAYLLRRGQRRTGLRRGSEQQGGPFWFVSPLWSEGKNREDKAKADAWTVHSQSFGLLNLHSPLKQSYP